MFYTFVFSVKMNCQPITQRLLSSGYIRPKKTITDSLQTKEAILDKLDGYIEVSGEEIDDIPTGSHIRYISFDKTTNKEMFRTGGIVAKVHPKYISLRGLENKSFSMQRYIYDDSGKVLHTTRVFKKLTDKEKAEIQADEAVEQLETLADKLAKKDEIIKALQAENAMLKKKLGSKKVN